MDLIYCSVCSSSRSGEGRVKVVDGGGGDIVILDRFIRVQENLVQHPSYYKSIARTYTIFFAC